MRAVLFDWRGTLVHDPPPSWWVTRALRQLGRAAEPGAVEQIAERIVAVSTTSEYLEAERTIDCDAGVHRTVTTAMFRAAGLDPELTDVLYELDFDAECHPFYPDARGVLAALHADGVRISIVSDIHFDLRPEFRQHGVAPFVDDYVLSFEHGTQKPDRRMFELALARIGVEASDALMVGDRASHDGGAVAAGLRTLLFPPLPSLGPRGLALVLACI